MNEGLNVKDKLFRIGCCLDDLCCLCNNATETIDHLFQCCQYSCRVRCAVECWIGRAFPSVTVLLNGNSQSVQWKVLAAVMNAVYYHIWMQRNNARVNNMLLRPEVIAKQIESEIKRRIKFKNTKHIDHYALNWLRKLGV